MNKGGLLEELQTTFSIPYSGDHTFPALPGSQDLPESHEHRFEAYSKAWTKCLNRIQFIVRQLLEPHIEEVARQVQDSSTVSGLPHPELPVVSISNPVFGASFLNDVCNRIDTPSTHLYPSDCTNMTSAMRSLVSGLAQEIDNVEQVRQKATTSLANYDINYLSAWYDEFMSTRDSRPTLLVVLHNFEEFDPAVMQDVFYICSQHLPELPLSFIVSLSTPLSTYLHIVYPRATLAYLRIRDVIIPSGLSVLNEIILQTFFSVNFDPDIIVGPTALQYISDFFTRHNRTLDSLLTDIQLVYMKHFSMEPLTSLVHSIPRPPSSALLEAAFVKLLAVDENAQKKCDAPAAVLDAIEESRAMVYRQDRRIRIAFNLTRLIQLFLVSEGYRGLGWNLEKDLCNLYIQYLKNSVERNLAQLNLTVRKLQIGQLGRLLGQIQEFMASIKAEEELMQTQDMIKGINKMLGRSNLSVEDSVHVAKQVAEWVDSFIRSLLGRLENVPLWEIWYTGLTPFPSELVNPSVRASVLCGLLRPLEFTSGQPDLVIDTDESLWKLADTSILCTRYLDSGKMINVYDWFESFQAVLENQREQLKKAAAKKAKQDSPKKRSPRKQSAKSKRKQREGEEDGGGDEDEVEEKWKLEIRARFIRGLHELDYLGFIKHTKRRADHVIRTVFDINE